MRLPAYIQGKQRVQGDPRDRIKAQESITFLLYQLRKHNASTFCRIKQTSFHGVRLNSCRHISHGIVRVGHVDVCQLILPGKFHITKKLSGYSLKDRVRFVTNLALSFYSDIQSVRFQQKYG